MKTKKSILMGLIVLLVIGLTAGSCASSGSAQSSKENEVGFIENAFRIVIEGLVESTQEAAEIQRRLTLEQKQAFLEMHLEATATGNSGLQSVKEAEGIGGKLNQILANIAAHTESVQEREQARRAGINEQTSAVNPHARTRQEVRDNN